MTEDLQASCECCFLILHTCYSPAQPPVCPSAPRGTHQENHSGRHGVNKPEVFVIQRKFSLLYENISMHEWKENETESKKSSAKSVVFPSQEKLAPAVALYVAELFALPQPHVNRLKSMGNLELLWIEARNVIDVTSLFRHTCPKWYPPAQAYVKQLSFFPSS